MSLFPSSSPYLSSYVDGDHYIKQKMDDFYAQNITLNQDYWYNADVDARFHAGDQTLYDEVYGNIPINRRRTFNFNRIRRVCNMITGHQRKNRKSNTVVPIENSDQKTADQLSALMMWSDEKDQTLHTISDAFEGAVISGMNLLSVWMDYREDPISGDIKTENVSYNGYLIDPFFKKKDLSDCSGIWTRKWVTKQQCKSLLPDRADDIDLLSTKGSKDDKFIFMPESYGYGKYDLLTYDEFWYKATRPQKLLVDTRTGETMEWKGSKEDLDLFLRRFRELVMIEQEVQTSRLAITVQGNVMYDGLNPMGIDAMPFVPVMAYYHPEIPYFSQRLQGVVRGLRDAQYLYNRRKVVELDILESQINSGWKYKEDALVNPADVFMSGQGKGLALKQEANMADVEPIQAAQIPPSMMELSRMLGEEIQQISGVNEELLGSADDDKAGVLSMLRQGAGLVTLQGLFDQLDQSQKLLGRIKISLMQANFTPGKIQRIIGEKPTPQFYSKAFGKYDCAVEEGLNTTTQKQMQFAQMLHLKEAGIPIPTSVLLQASTLQNKEQLTSALQQQEEQQAKMQQMQMELALQKLQAETENIKAQATANVGLGLERSSRVQENRAFAIERLAESEKDREQAALNRVKAMKEMESMDLDQLERLFTLVQMVKDYKDPQERDEEFSMKTPNVEEIATMAQTQGTNKTSNQGVANEIQR